MAEADTSAEVHQTVHDDLQNDVVPAVKSWQKTKYIKSMMHIKSTKDFEEEFRRVRREPSSVLIIDQNFILGAETLGKIIRKSG